MSARKNETEQQRKKRLERIKLAARERRANETPEQRRERLERGKIAKHLRREKETPEQRRQRLQRECEANRLRRKNETHEERRYRLDQQFKANRLRRKNETPEQRLRRLEQQKKHNHFVRTNETPEERRRRLEQLSRNNHSYYHSKLKHMHHGNKTGEQAQGVYCTAHSQENADAQILNDIPDVQLHTLLTSEEVKEITTQIKSETLILPDVDTRMDKITTMINTYENRDKREEAEVHVNNDIVKTELRPDEYEQQESAVATSNNDENIVNFMACYVKEEKHVQEEIFDNEEMNNSKEIYIKEEGYDIKENVFLPENFEIYTEDFNNDHL